MRITFIMLTGLLIVTPAAVIGAELPQPKPTPGHVMLPQEHQYQRVLRKHLATLVEKDFDHGITELLTKQATSSDPECQYRMFIMTMMQQPLVGWKRGTPAVNAPPRVFLLSSIEGLETPNTPATPTTETTKPAPKQILVPPVWSETLVAFTQWDHPGNPYHDNRPLKLRAFVTAAVQMMMLDDFFDTNPHMHRADWNAYKLVSFGSTYLGVKIVLPAEVQQAFEEGLLKLGRRMITWGVKGEEPNLDMTGPLGFWYVSQACHDPEFTQQAEDYSRRLMTDPRYFHPAGYWVERGSGIDVGFAGMANFYAVWTALMTDWPFAKDTVERIYRLRAHLSLPEPDGTFNGPSHFNARIGSPACEDQWHWDGAREAAAAMVTDEAAYLIKQPTEQQLAGAADNRISWFNFQIKQNPVRRDAQGRRAARTLGYVPNELLHGHPWTWRLWPTYNFPASINPGWEFYRQGAYAHLLKLHKEKSLLLQSPYQRKRLFLRNFADAFIVTRQKSYNAILHTGPVGSQDPNDGLVQYKGPMGFGGGQLSAFATAKTGSVILGRRLAMNFDENYDTLDIWRLWPLHAVTGATPDGKVFSTARILQPEVTSDIKRNQGTVTVSGVLPADPFDQGQVLAGRLDYRRIFRIEPDGVHVETTVEGDGKDTIAELYETLPVFLREAKKQAKTTPTAIEFQVGGEWTTATDEYAEKVTAVRLSRFDGAVIVTFDSPQHVKLSPQDWQDTYQTRASCRNVMIDLLESGDKPVVLTDAKTVGYRIEPAAK